MAEGAKTAKMDPWHRQPPVQRLEKVGMICAFFWTSPLNRRSELKRTDWDELNEECDCD